jgi:hypothetical protein
MGNGTAKPQTNEAQDTSTYALRNFPIDEARPIKVVAIGAGYSGRRYLARGLCDI